MRRNVPTPPLLTPQPKVREKKNDRPRTACQKKLCTFCRHTLWAFLHQVSVLYECNKSVRMRTCTFVMDVQYHTLVDYMFILHLLLPLKPQNETHTTTALKAKPVAAACCRRASAARTAQHSTAQHSARSPQSIKAHVIAAARQRKCFTRSQSWRES